MSELLNCPFCGDKAAFNTVQYTKVHVSSQGWDQDTFHGVNCISCGTNNRGVVGWGTKEEAADAWNRRADTSKSAEPADVIEFGASLLGHASETDALDDSEARGWVHARWIEWEKDTGKSAEAWQPIETAPKDGTRVLLRGGKGRIADGSFETVGSSNPVSYWSWPYVHIEPTHYMPLPDATISGRATDGGKP